MVFANYDLKTSKYKLRQIAFKGDGTFDPTNLRHMKTSIFPLLFLLFAFTATAQTNSFNVTIPFASESRTLSCYVPENYDSTQSYELMICLHGLGDNSINYRNALITSLNWPALFPNTIFICPDGGSDANKDFYAPVGDQEIITASMAYAKDHFSIDTSAIYLQGFSLGGRSALKFGLESPQLFKGLLLNTPALQGLLDEQNNPFASLMYNYTNAAQLPMFITVGETDYTYQYQVGALVSTLKKNNAPIRFELVSGLGHSIPGSGITQKAVAFLVNKNLPDIDADLFALNESLHFCSSAIQTTCLVRNNGDSVIHSLSLNLSTGNTAATQSWAGTILPNHYVLVPVSLTVPAGGNYTFTATITMVNGITDADTLNNTMTQDISVASSATPNTVLQTFDNPSNNWLIRHTGNLFEWSLDETVGHSGTTSMSMFNSALLFYSRGAIEQFASPVMNVKALAKKELQFDVAFNYFQYTPPYVAATMDFADTLEILVSTDCGATYTRLYKKGGKDLATASEPIVNALSIPASMFNPTHDEWRTETINLSSIANAEQAIFAFNCISAMGGVLYIDNISFGEAYVGMFETAKEQNSIRLYPNPASDMVTIDIPANDVSGDIIITDITGKIVLQQPVQTAQQQLSLSEIPAGLYFVQLTAGGYSNIQKLLIRK